MVDTNTESFHVALKYMTRLLPEDLVDPSLSPLAAQTNLTSAQFAEEFSRLFNPVPA
jgi:hypothetical protein